MNQPPRHEIIADLETGDPSQIKRWLHEGIYGDSGYRYDVVSKWVELKDSERDLALKSRSESREVESNESAEEANRIALEANDLASEANKRALRAESRARAAIYIALATLIIQA